jgi:hypothetical protein
MDTIKIYEFSTGIDLQGTSDNWWSSKFTGYMNNTLGYIPEAVQDAISDALFDVAEGKATDKPAIIGREVEKQGDAWSVIAVVTAAKDEKGRTISVYRYFLTQGKGKLGDLVWWYFGDAKKPIFDPFNKPSDYYPYKIYPTKEQNIEKLLKTDNFQELLKLLNGDEKTIVIPHDLKCQNEEFNILWAKSNDQFESIPSPKNRIKEGKTIKLGGSEPREQNGQQIGSDIYIEGLPLYIGHFLVTNEGTEFFPKKDMFHQFEIKGILLTSDDAVSVKHSDLIVFENNNQKYYFTYYDYKDMPLAINELAIRQLVKQYLMEVYKTNPISVQEDLDNFLNYKLGQLNPEEKKQKAKKYLKQIHNNQNLQVTTEELEGFIDSTLDKMDEEEQKKLAEEYLLRGESVNVNDHVTQRMRNMLPETIRDYACKHMTTRYKTQDNSFSLLQDELDNFIAYKLDSLVKNNQIDENIKKSWLNEYEEPNLKLTQSDLPLFVQQLINEPGIIQQKFEQLKNIPSQYLVAWAYNVEGLTKPWSFEVVFPASAEAEEVIKKEKEEGVTIPKPVEGQYGVSIALNNLANQGKVTTSYLDDINKAVAPESQQIYTEQIWEKSVFHQLDIQKAKNHPSYPPAYVRLYLLYGLILPQHFSSFLKWLARKNNNVQSKKNDVHLNQKSIQAKREQYPYKTALELSEKMNNELSTKDNPSYLLDKVSQNIEQLLIKLISPGSLTQEDELLKEWLLLDQKGLWGKACQWLTTKLWEDIEQLKKNYEEARQNLIDAYGETQSTNNLPESEITRILNDETDDKHNYRQKYASENLKILKKSGWGDVKKTFIDLIWKKPCTDTKKVEYLKLAESLDKISDSYPKTSQSVSKGGYSVSGYFYQISQGEIPTSVWEKMGDSRDPNNKNEYPDFLVRKLRWWEKLFGGINNFVEKQYKFWFNPDLQPKPFKPLLLRYFVISAFILLLGIILFDILEFSPKKLSKESLIGAKKFFATFRIRDNEENSKDEPDLFEELYKIPKDFSTYLGVDPKDSQDAIIQILQESGSSEGTVTLTWNTDKEQWNKNELQWKTAIIAYQQKIKVAKPDLNVGFNGLLRKDDDTDKRLRCEIIQKLQADEKSITGVTKDKVKECATKYGVEGIKADKTGSPANNGGTSIPSTPSTATSWQATVTAIDALRDEFVKMGQNKLAVEDAIIKNIAAGYVYKDKADRQDYWTPKIKNLQKENSITETGFISQSDGTYKALKCKVAEELKLTDQVPGCPKKL